MKTVKFLFLVAFASFFGQAGAQQLAEVHISKGVPCAACHTENPPAKRVKTPKCQECHGDYSNEPSIKAGTRKKNINRAIFNSLLKMLSLKINGTDLIPVA